MIALELFGCSGGIAEGFRRAGIEFTWAVDADPNACASYEANLGHAVVQCDVRDLLIDWTAQVEAGCYPDDWQLDLLVADPPCTPWSRSGKREGTRDPRDMLQVTCDLIRALRPRCYLIGNVPGLDDADNWQRAVVPIIGGLSSAGYCTLDYTRLDAAAFGVPQHRVRPWWFGHLGGSCIRWPLPTHGDTSTLRLDGCLPYVTCRDALGHLSPEELGRPVTLVRQDRPDGRSAADRRNGSRVGGHPSQDRDRPSRTVTVAGHGRAGTVLLGHVDGHPPSELDAPAKTITAARTGEGGRGGRLLVTDTQHPHMEADEPARVVRAGSGGGARGVLALEPPPPPTGKRPSGRQDVSQSRRRGQPDEPSATVTTRPDLGQFGHHDSGRPNQQPNAVTLSEKAGAILQGFPDASCRCPAVRSDSEVASGTCAGCGRAHRRWVFAGDTKPARWSQIGQATPPALAQAVAESIVRWFRANPNRYWPNKFDP